MLPLVIVCSCRRGAPTVFKCVWHVLDATLDGPGTAMRTRTPLTSRVLGALPRGAGQDRVLRACTAPNQGSEGQRQERAGCTEHQSRESGFRARLCSQNQGSQGRLRVIPGFRARHCSQTRVHRAFPGLEKRQTRVPRGRKEANKGSQRSKRGKQGFPGVKKRQTRVHSGLKEANKGSQGPGPRKPGFSGRKKRKTGFPVQQST